jgi:hypothetical protein
VTDVIDSLPLLSAPLALAWLVWLAWVTIQVGWFRVARVPLAAWQLAPPARLPRPRAAASRRDDHPVPVATPPSPTTAAALDEDPLTADDTTQQPA